MEHKVAAKKRTQVIREGENGEMVQIKRKSRGIEMTSRLTKRAVARILVAVQQKLQRMISDLTNNEHDPEAVREALEDPKTKGVVQKHIQAEGIRMIDPTRDNKSVFKTQMSLIGDKGDSAMNAISADEEVIDDGIDPEEAQLVSKTATCQKYVNHFMDKTN